MERLVLKASQVSNAKKLELLEWLQEMNDDLDKLRSI